MNKQASKHPTLGNGKNCYLQIPGIDIERSVEFYSKVFSWNIRHRDDGTIAFDDGVNEVSGTWWPDCAADWGDAPMITARFPDPAGNLLGLFSQ